MSRRFVFIQLLLDVEVELRELRVLEVRLLCNGKAERGLGVVADREVIGVPGNQLLIGLLGQIGYEHRKFDQVRFDVHAHSLEVPGQRLRDRFRRTGGHELNRR